MRAEATPDWNVCKHIFADHGDGFRRGYPRDNQRYEDALVPKRLAGGTPNQRGYIAYRCLQCGEGPHRVARRCQSSLC
jgi:hypothetical protein